MNDNRECEGSDDGEKQEPESEVRQTVQIGSQPDVEGQDDLEQHPAELSHRAPFRLPSTVASSGR